MFSRPLRMMALKTGIVGLPNVGKSTLFNALVENSNAEAANYPFCTIEPNSGIVPVPDERLQALATISGTSKDNIVPTTVEFVDIAGLVKGAADGAGLGNKFLANIRECDAIVHVVRCFDDDDVIHVDGKVDPVSDIETINAELALNTNAELNGRYVKGVRIDKDSFSASTPGQDVEITFAATGLSNVKQFEVRLRIEPEAAFDLAASSFAPLQPFISPPTSVERTEDGLWRTGGASVTRVVEGDAQARRAARLSRARRRHTHWRESSDLHRPGTQSRT